MYSLKIVRLNINLRRISGHHMYFVALDFATARKEQSYAVLAVDQNQ